MTFLADKSLTCRQWRLNPTGCFDGSLNCRYSHHDTGVMGPPTNITCCSWKYGSCPLQDECLFSHRDIGPKEQPVSLFYRPALIGKNSAIAQAAANAGFDTSNIENLKTLINAIREADHSIYPDYYEGQAKYRDSLYPDYWVPARLQETQRVAQLYQKFNPKPSLSSFVIRYDKILRDLTRHANKSCKRPCASGANLEPLSSAFPNKRARKDTPQWLPEEIEGSKPKIKTVAPSKLSNNKVVVDLTEPDISDPRDKMFKEQQHENEPVHKVTIEALCTVLSSLQANKNTISMNREVLRKQWELDPNLRFQTVTDDLQQLNGYFAEAQNIFDIAIDLVKHRLLSNRPRVM